jgi:hypothetical protein
MALVISQRVRDKLASKPTPVNEDEIIQCFANRLGEYLLDEREDNKTDPPTKWFVAETDYGRKLKVVFMHKEDVGVIIKTAYDPNSEEIRIYRKYGRR